MHRKATYYVKSVVDAPGHESLMATMFQVQQSLTVPHCYRGERKCPQAQTAEHLTALEIAGIKNIIIVQNKIDLVDKEQAMKNEKQVRDF